MSDDSAKDAFDAGYDAVADQPDDDAAGDAFAGAMAAWTNGFDTSDPDARVALMLSFVNGFAYNLTLPQPSDDHPEELTDEEKAAFGKRMNSLAQSLAMAYAEWDVKEFGPDRCVGCGESLQFDEKPSKGSTKVN